MNLNQIYQRLKQQAERNGQEIDEGRLRQQAWVMRDRMMFESSINSNSSSAAGAGGGGGGLRRSIENIVVGVFNQAYILTWVDDSDDKWKIAVFNFDTGVLSEIINTELIYDDANQWDLDNNWRHIQNGGFTISYRNEITNKYKVFFISANGEVHGIKDLDNNEDFQYTENAQGYLGEKDSVSTFYHFPNTGVYTHQFEGVDIDDIEIDDASEDDVTKDGSMIVEAPDSSVDQSIEKFYIARPNGNLVDITEHLLFETNYRIDYNTEFIIADIRNEKINVVSQEGNLLNSFDLPESLSENEFTLFGENCAYFNYNVTDEEYKYIVVYDGDDNRFITTTYSSFNDNYRTYTERSWFSPSSSFGKSLVISSWSQSSFNDIGVISDRFELQWLPKGASEFYKQELNESNTIFILGDDFNFSSNRTFTQGENPLVMFATESHIQVGFLTEDGLVVQSTGITASSCTNIWGHNIGEKSFAIFDIAEDTNRIWQIYGTNSIEGEVITSEFWSLGSNERYSNINGTLAVIDSGASYSNSFFYTRETGIQNLDVNRGEIYNEKTHGNRTGISGDHQVIVKENISNEILGFYVLSRSGLSDFIDLETLLNDSGYFISSASHVVIGDNVISFRFSLDGHTARRILVFNKSTLELIHDTGNIQANRIEQYGDRTIIEILNIDRTTTLKFIHKSGEETLNISQSGLDYESNDTTDND